MRIVLHLDNAEPPEGHVGTDANAFFGWLGLVRALADAVAAAEPDDGERSVAFESWAATE